MCIVITNFRVARLGWVAYLSDLSKTMRFLKRRLILAHSSQHLKCEEGHLDKPSATTTRDIGAVLNRHAVFGFACKATPDASVV